MSTISTHILDTSTGEPASGVAVVLSRCLESGAVEEVGRGITDADGRLRDLVPGGGVAPGVYVLAFETGAYFAADGREAFYPRVEVRFQTRAGRAHYHIPLLVSPYGYSTYRGS